jgi:hypothetical protein
MKPLEGGATEAAVRMQKRRGRPSFSSAWRLLLFVSRPLDRSGRHNSQKNLSMKIELCYAATKKNPERFNARGFVSCGLS